MQIEAIILFAMYICVEMHCSLRIYLKILHVKFPDSTHLDYFLYRLVDSINQEIA